MRLISWNPLTLVQPCRVEEISDELHACDFIVLPATKLLHSDFDVKTRKLPHHTMYSWTRRREDWAAGCSILVRPQVGEVVKVWKTPAKIKGRAGAIRVKSRNVDICIFVAYFPPSPKKMTPEKEENVRGIFDWMQKVRNDLPGRCTMFAGIDLNDCLVVLPPDRLYVFAVYFALFGLAGVDLTEVVLSHHPILG